MRQVAISRTETPIGWWELARSRPDDRLGELVARFCGYQERSHDVVERTMAAGPKLPLILTFGDPIELDYPDGPAVRRESFVAGLHPGPATTRYTGGQYGVQVDLTPLGAFRLLGVPGAVLAHQAVPLADLAPWLGPSFADRLAFAKRWPERFDHVEQALLARWADGPAADPMVAWLWRRLEASHGRASIADLVAETGRSHRHVTSRFTEQIGLTPKAAANLLRFENATRAIARRRLPLAEAAVATGYADQSHLTREFVRLAGAPPRAWLAAMDRTVEVEFVQDLPAGVT